MEIIETPEFQIFLASELLDTGASWTTVTPPGFWMGILLEGQVWVHQGAQGEGPWVSGGSAIFASDAEIETCHRALSGGRMSAVFLRLNPDAAVDLLGPDGVDRFAGQDHRSLPDLARTIAWQMQGCRLQGHARRLYLRGKALEMAALGINPADGQDASIHLSPREIQALYLARDGMLANLGHTPAIADLARQAGMSMTLFGQGFRVLFDDSPYAWLKSQRLERARMLLETRGLAVSDAARQVGYQAQHFSVEFRKRFGIAPSCIKPQRGNSRTVAR